MIEAEFDRQEMSIRKSILNGLDIGSLTVAADLKREKEEKIKINAENELSGLTRVKKKWNKENNSFGAKVVSGVKHYAKKFVSFFF